MFVVGDEEIARARVSARPARGLSRFLVYPPSGQPPRRLSAPVQARSLAGVHRATRWAIRDDAGYAIGAGDWPCANLAYHSLTHSGGYSSLLLSRRELCRSGERIREATYDRNATRRRRTGRGGKRIAKHARRERLVAACVTRTRIAAVCASVYSR